MDKERLKKLIPEFLRYVVVGGLSALVDMGVLWGFTEFIFDGRNKGFPLAISIAAGFCVGLAVNYFLSMLFVFTTGEQKEKSRGKFAFLIYAAVGLIGFGLTELLMFLGMLFTPEQGLWYLVLNAFVKGIVLIWNYVGRKIFVYRGN